MPSTALCNRLERMINKFFWGSKNISKAIHWAAWDKNCGVFEEGGLGCKSLNDTAIAFSHKLWFSFRSNSSLWARFMNFKYCFNRHPIFGYFKNTDSLSWKRLCNIKWEAEEYIQWGLGRGDIYFWQDKWLGDFSIDSFLNTHTLEPIKVSNFIINNGWKVDCLRNILPNNLVDIILNIPLNVNSSDNIICSASSNGKFQMHKLWEKFRQTREKSDRFAAIWHNSFPITYSTFVWRCFKGFLPVDKLLQKKGFFLASKCLCCSNVEDINHLFINGQIARKVWSYFILMTSKNVVYIPDNLFEMVDSWFIPKKGHIFNLIPILILWYIWKARNEAKHDNIKMDEIRIIDNVKRKIIQLYNCKVISSKAFYKCKNIGVDLGIQLEVDTSDYVDSFVYWIKPHHPFVKLNTDGSVGIVNAGAGVLYVTLMGIF
ncbi:hypothetical protein KFK09_026251 [Dendrobium nobile]|nr:hypothetical protein KFK09_026251 [Dendrobium nobile]